MKVAILQSNYIPWKGYFDLINSVDVFIIYDCVKYTKNDWRNRNIIYPKQGKQWLTIPISSSSVQLCIDEVRITDSRWQNIHAKTLVTSYSRAPQFNQLRELIDDFLLYRKWDYLSELNIELIKWISQRIGITSKIRNAREFSLQQNRIGRLLGILNEIGAREYLSGPSASAYLEGQESLFEERGIKLRYTSYGPYLPYKQLKEPFESSVSIIDLIANLPWEDIKLHVDSSNSLSPRKPDA